MQASSIALIYLSMSNTSKLNQYIKEGVGVTILSVVVNILLSSAKIFLGSLIQSGALFADGLHSLVDLSTDIAVLFGFKMASKPEDENHPYGHHKFVSLSNFLIGLIIIFFSLLLVYTSYRDLFLSHPYLVSPTWLALFVALASVIFKEALYWWTRFYAKKHNSKILMANAIHHRLDSFTSILALIALSAIFFGGQEWGFLDKIVGLGMGAYIAFEGIKIIVSASRDLLDEAPDQKVINDLREHILSTPGALAYHHFRVRRIGDLFEIDFHLQVDPKITVVEGHKIASRVKQNILKYHSEAYNVLVHIEPATERHIKAEGVHDAALEEDVH